MQEIFKNLQMHRNVRLLLPTVHWRPRAARTLYLFNFYLVYLKY